MNRRLPNRTTLLSKETTSMEDSWEILEEWSSQRGFTRDYLTCFSKQSWDSIQVFVIEERENFLKLWTYFETNVDGEHSKGEGEYQICTKLENNLIGKFWLSEIICCFAPPPTVLNDLLFKILSFNFVSQITIDDKTTSTSTWYLN